jgi:hypothetical protein
MPREENERRGDLVGIGGILESKCGWKDVLLSRQEGGREEGGETR